MEDQEQNGLLPNGGDGVAGEAQNGMAHSPPAAAVAITPDVDTADSNPPASAAQALSICEPAGGALSALHGAASGTPVADDAPSGDEPQLAGSKRPAEVDDASEPAPKRPQLEDGGGEGGVNEDAPSVAAAPQEQRGADGAEPDQQGGAAPSVDPGEQPQPATAEPAPAADAPGADRAPSAALAALAAAAAAAGRPPGSWDTVIRLVVPQRRVGLIIGKSGSTVNELQASTGARIQLMPPLHACDDRVVILSAPEDAAAPQNGAQLALLALHRVLTADGGGAEPGPAGVHTARLLLTASQAAGVEEADAGAGGGASVRTLPASELPACALAGDWVVAASGPRDALGAALDALAMHVRCSLPRERPGGPPPALAERIAAAKRQQQQQQQHLQQQHQQQLQHQQHLQQQQQQQQAMAMQRPPMGYGMLPPRPPYGYGGYPMGGYP